MEITEEMSEKEKKRIYNKRYREKKKAEDNFFLKEEVKEQPKEQQQIILQMPTPQKQSITEKTQDMLITMTISAIFTMLPGLIKYGFTKVSEQSKTDMKKSQNINMNMETSFF
jgi:hypothetical protein